MAKRKQGGKRPPMKLDLKEGTFTAWCKRQGFDVSDGVPEACIAKGLKSKDPRIRRKANFAKVSRTWKH